jgi:hypothetical protein
MTQSEQTVRQIFAGDDSATPLAFVIPYFNSSDIVVESELDGATATLVNGVDYTISGGDGIAGTVTPLAAIASGTNWIIYRTLPRTQPIDFENQDTILPSAIEEAVDRVTLMLMEETDQSSRAIKADAGEINPTGLTMPDLATRASQLLQWDANGEISAIDPGTVIPDSYTVSAYMQGMLVSANWVALRKGINMQYGLDADKGVVIDPLNGHIWWATDTLIFYFYYSGQWRVMSASQETTVKPNLIINGTAQINQRVTCNSGSEFPNDDFSFCMDHVLLLSEGDNACTVENDTADSPDGSSHCFKLSAATNDVKFGLLFPLDSLKASDLLSAGDDKVCSIRFKYKATSGVQNVRAMVLVTSGTVDQLVDPINAWGAAGSEPTLTGTYSREGGASEDIPTDTAWQTYELTDIAIDSGGALNVALFLWVDDDDLVASTDIVYFADVQLNEGAALAPYSRPSFAQEYQECIRFFQKSFSYTQEPGSDKGNLGIVIDIVEAPYQDAAGVSVRLQTPMHKVPTLATYNPGAAGATWQNITKDSSAGSPSGGYTADSGFTLLAENTGLVARKDVIGIHYTAVAEIIP